MADNPFTVKVPSVMEALMVGNKGYETGRQWQQDRALNEAAPFIQSGDYKGAMEALIRGKNLQGALAVGQLGNSAATQNIALGNLDVNRANAQTQRMAVQGGKPALTTVGAPDGSGRKNAAIVNPDTGKITYVGSPMGDEVKLDGGSRKAIFDSEDELGNLKSTKEVLGEAKLLVPKAFTGAMASGRAWAGANLPDWMVPDGIADPAGSDATVRLNQILSGESIQAMSKTLKGATTDKEMLEFKNILADPKASVANKLAAIDRMERKVALQEKIGTDRINQLRGGTYFKPSGGMSAPNDPLAAARTAIEQGADRAKVIERLQKNGINPAGL